MAPRKQRQLQERLAGMAEFAALFQAPDFRFGEIVSSPVRETEEALVYTSPYSVLSPEAQRFAEKAYGLGWVRPDVDWMKWQGSAEARRLQNPATIVSANPDQLAKLLTMVLRDGHWTETALVAAFNSGLLTAIVKGMAALLEQASLVGKRRRRIRQTKG
jgi:hypothetical protein